MRYLHATFKNYIGFYNGMGLSEVSVDFTKCKHNIVLISGKNGSGKSTLLFHLNPFPDGSNSFIPNKSAEKDLILSNNGDIYNIQIYSPADLKSRKTTKAYIQKNGVELNENGNVSSYKDIIFSEFELDSNYISLSRLSSTDRGLGDKTPAERKKFVSNIIENLEIYNDMYKTLNKKSLIYKSHLGTLHTKIQNIGSKDMLDQRLRILKSKEQELKSKIMEFNNQIVAIQAKNSIDEDEAREIQEASNLSNSIKIELDKMSISLDTFYNKTKISKEIIKDKYETDLDLQTKYKTKVSELSSSWKEKSSRLSNVSSNIISLEAELSSTITEDNIAERYNKTKKEINEMKSNLIQLGFNPDDEELFDKLKSINIFIDKFIKYIDSFYDNLNSDDANSIVLSLDGSYNAQLMNKQNAILDKISSKKEEIVSLQSKLHILEVLENRPKNCKIDSCPFIHDSLKLSKQIKKDPVEELSKLQKELLELTKTSTEIQNNIDHIASLSPKRMILQRIIDSISENESILNEFYPDFINTFNNRIIDINQFGEFRDNRFIDALNIEKILEDLYSKDKILEVEYKGYNEKVKLLNASRSMLDKLKKEEEELVLSTSNIKKELDEYTNTLANISDNINIEYQYYELFMQYKEKENQYNIAYSKVEEYNKKSSKALEALSTINTLKEEIDRCNVELNPITTDISSILGQLTLLDSYYIEYNEYKKSYDIIEILKKYCSPTGGGIQTIFMEIYMSKTKQLANEVLAMLFNGAYQLQDFIINENEFRIPFIGEGLPVDDISSGSASQIAMMSLVINLVLLHQASTKFNIAFLDEIESALDGYNRTNFINVLFHSINILEIEQMFLISHSIEVDNTFADIIKLKGYDNFDSIVDTGNVIWDYNNIIATNET